MGRVKEFDIANALNKAMNVFWEKGYENASLKDLLQEMNILNGSFYNTFGNKKALFIKTLEHYQQEVSIKRGERFADADGFKKGVRLFFKDIFDCSKDGEIPKGCLLVNSLSGEMLKDKDIVNYIQAQMSNFELFFRVKIKEGIDSKELDSDLDAEMLASLLVTYTHGLMKRECLSSCPDKLQQQTELFLDSLGL